MAAEGPQQKFQLCIVQLALEKPRCTACRCWQHGSMEAWSWHLVALAPHGQLLLSLVSLCKNKVHCQAMSISQQATWRFCRIEGCSLLAHCSYFQIHCARVGKRRVPCTWALMSGAEKRAREPEEKMVGSRVGCQSSRSTQHFSAAAAACRACGHQDSL